MELQCPMCGLPTEHLKRARYMRLLVFLFVGSWWQEEIITACPSCLRRRVWRNCFINLLPANLLWPFLMLPWALVLTLTSRSRGHSKVVLDEMKAMDEYSRRMQAQGALAPGLGARYELRVREDASFFRIMAVVALLTFWLPLLGLLITLLAWYLNRGIEGWTARVSRVTLWISLLIHGGLAFLFVVSLIITLLR
ncbi:MAG: hypothetical protein U0840_30325 [Gemmataceae bacterium]